jgi:Glycine zipper
MPKRLLILALFFAFIAADASAQSYRRRGAIVGGLAGAAIGAAIGDKENNETAGALIGGAIGVVAGSAIGDQKDQRVYQSQVYHSGHYYNGQPQPSYPAYSVQHPAYTVQHPAYVETVPVAPVYPTTPPTVPVSPQDVVAMSRSGLSDATIIRHIQLNGVHRALSVSEVIQLHQDGVSEPVIHAMQAASNRGVSPVPSNTVPNYPVPHDYNTYGPSILHEPMN